MNRAPLNPRKLPEVSSRFGAPMGRRSDVLPGDAEDWRENVAVRSVRIAWVPFCDGAYDNGGSYWGSPANLYLVQWQLADETGDGVEWCAAYVRGASRREVADRLAIPPACLFRRID